MNRGKRGHLKVSSHHSAPTSPSVWILCKPLASNPPESPRNRGNGYETERAPCRAAAHGGFVVWRVERRLLQMLPVWRMFLDGSCSRKENDITSRHHAHLGIMIICIQSTNVAVALAPFLVTQKKKKKKKRDAWRPLRPRLTQSASPPAARRRSRRRLLIGRVTPHLCHAGRNESRSVGVVERRCMMRLQEVACARRSRQPPLKSDSCDVVVVY